MRKLVLVYIALIHAYVGYSCMCVSVLQFMRAQDPLCIRMQILRMQGLSCVCIVPSRIPKIEHFSSFLICFSSVCSFNIILHHF